MTRAVDEPKVAHGVACLFCLASNNLAPSSLQTEGVLHLSYLLDAHILKDMIWEQIFSDIFTLVRAM